MNNPTDDWKRKQRGIQAVRLSLFSALVRRVCYLLAQKGDPSIN